MVGNIKTLNFEKGFGFIKSNNIDYYFRINISLFSLEVGDKVHFLVKKYKGKDQAQSVVKVYTNKFGIEIIPRFNMSHIHLNLDEYLPLIYNEIINTDLEFIEIEKKFDRIIGTTDCLQTESEENIVYGIRIGRLGHTRFIKNAVPVNTNSLFAAFKKENDLYVIVTIFCGEKSAKEPWDERADENDLIFWENHALIYQKEKIIADSEISICPWDLRSKAISKYPRNGNPPNS